jgi:hypothetical protein
VHDSIFVGDQLQKDVQRWLSPPNPSTNQNFVRKARHAGTAAWFFESSALTEWQANGSLLWIYGKRTSLKAPMSHLSNTFIDPTAGAGKSTLLCVVILYVRLKLFITSLVPQSFKKSNSGTQLDWPQWPTITLISEM